jgi:hypothetical protein
MAKLSKTQRPYALALAAAAFATTFALSTAPAAADAMSELLLFNFGTEADPANREAAKDTPDGPMPLLPVELAQMADHGAERDRTSETGAGGS